ncbi:MAG: hypothetical protein K2X11_07160 [Acetobacteraceae bacterium]|nr:hypothetical protein [Acetobacteraceae bacterium]
MTYASLVVPHAEEGGHGWHWEPFTDDIHGQLPVWITEVVEGGVVAVRHPMLDRWRLPLPGGAPRAVALLRTDTDIGLCAIIEIAEDSNNLASLFPFVGRGVQTTATPREIRLLAGANEAILTLEVGGALVTAFDTSWADARTVYAPGRAVEVLLSGLALELRPALPETVEVALPDNLPEGLPGGRRHVRLDTGAWILPLADGTADHAQVQGLVRRVEVLRPVLGRPAWLLRVAALRPLGADEGEEHCLDLLVTDRAWHDVKPPTPGQTVQGIAWLQCRIWGVTADFPEDQRGGPAP